MTKQASLPASSTFEAFLESGIDRCAFISAWLRAKDIPHSIVELSQKRHIVVRFDSSAYDPFFRMKTLVAHYDRVADSVGANDNSAACFQLMLFAEQLSRGKPASSLVHNIRIFFTDGEEAAGTYGIAGQGSFALGSGMRKLRITEDDVYVFDACGRGDTLILSTAGLTSATTRGIPPRPPRFTARIESLHERSCALAREAAPENWVRLPTPYSDNAGFIASGIAAQVFTVLPHEEAGKLLFALGGNEVPPEKIIAAIEENRTLPDESPLKPIIPETWRFMHTKADTGATLNASAFSLMAKLLDTIKRRMDRS